MAGFLRAAGRRLYRARDGPAARACVACLPAQARASRLMGFLTPLAWLLALAVAVPLILHLFQRHQGPRVIFPALRYLRRAEKEHARRIRLRQIFLLALRVLAVLLLAFAAAR